VRVDQDLLVGCLMWLVVLAIAVLGLIVFEWVMS